ncbi:hypothetical protein TNCV_638191 [Trichonephila clavipes]|nr:hypothetical protein TNCV_638191 [Trichonephila clavipes]
MVLRREHYRAMVFYGFKAGLNQKEYAQRLQLAFASAHAENVGVNELWRHCCPFVLERRIVTGGKVRAAKRLLENPIHARWD